MMLPGDAFDPQALSRECQVRDDNSGVPPPEGAPGIPQGFLVWPEVAPTAPGAKPKGP